MQIKLGGKIDNCSKYDCNARCSRYNILYKLPIGIVY